MIRTALTTSLVLWIAACSGSDDDAEKTGVTGETGADTGAPAGNSIVDIASADDRFDTLVSAVVDAGLADTLTNGGPFTVFAPTDDAFEGVDLSGLSTEQLAEILTYHVVEGEVDSGSVPALADSVAGFTLFFDTSSGVVVNDATVTQADIKADNGIIHVIDTVLIPPDILGAAGFAGLTDLATTIGSADPSITTLLESDGPFTVFAPTNAAFASADLTGLDVNEVLTYHVFADGEVLSDAIPATAPSALVNDFDFNVSWVFDTTSGVSINGASVAIADVKTTNGVVHVIDGVLTPPDIVDLAGFAGLTDLATNLTDAGLVPTLQGAGPFTVFAPTNGAFTDASALIDTLTANQVENVLLYHVADTSTFTDPVESGDLTQDQTILTLQGEDITVDLTNGPQVNGTDISLPDVHGTNGVVHVVEGVLVPPSKSN